MSEIRLMWFTNGTFICSFKSKHMTVDWHVPSKIYPSKSKGWALSQSQTWAHMRERLFMWKSIWLIIWLFWKLPNSCKCRYRMCDSVEDIDIFLGYETSKHVKSILIEHYIAELKHYKGPFYWHGLTLIPVWINNHMSCNVWDEITYPFLNFNGATV